MLVVRINEFRLNIMYVMFSFSVCRVYSLSYYYSSLLDMVDCSYNQKSPCCSLYFSKR